VSLEYIAVKTFQVAVDQLNAGCVPLHNCDRDGEVNTRRGLPDVGRYPLTIAESVSKLRQRVSTDIPAEEK
jgi:hypothetical protein